MAYPIASMADGRVKYSDGSIRSKYASYADSPPSNSSSNFTSSNYTPSNTDYDAIYKSAYDPIAAEVDKFADELIAEAKGDYDYAAKWIENNYKLALGEDSTARAEFLKQVANSMEQKVGRIAFDYNTGKYRKEEDIRIGTERTTQARDLALKRLAEDEVVARKQMTQEAGQARQTQAESLSERGLLSGPRGTEGGIEGRNVQELETQLGDKLSAFERTLGRTKQDITDDASKRLFDINLAGGRDIEDLTTTARRDAQNEQMARDKGIEYAERARQKAIAEAERERYAGKSYAKKYATLYGSGSI